MTEANGRLKLSWAQIAWGIAVIVGVLGSWADLRIGQARMEEKLSAQGERITRLEGQARAWKGVDEAHAAPR